MKLEISDQTRAAEPNALRTMEEGLQRICPGWSHMPAPTFSCGPGVDASWFRWREEIYLPALRPALYSAMEAARRGYHRDLVAADLSLHAQLSRQEREQSLGAGKRFLSQSDAPRLEKCAEKYYESVRAGVSPGHAVTFLGLRGAIFHLPAAVCEGSYLLMELLPSCAARPDGFLEKLIRQGLSPRSGQAGIRAA
jgi:hypothetical protein